MDQRQSIFYAASACQYSFEEARRTEELAKNEWAENRLADFNMWAAGIGARTNNKLSLDARLALKPEIRDTVVNLLQVLRFMVDKCISLANSMESDLFFLSSNGQAMAFSQSKDEEREHEQRPVSPWSDASSSESELEDFSVEESSESVSASMRKVQTLLEQLSRISFAIRRSGISRRLWKADQRLKLDDHVDLRDHLTTILLCKGHFSSQTSFDPAEINSHKLNDIQIRLINCNLRRRNRFIYAQTHEKKLGTPGHYTDFFTEERSSQVVPIQKGTALRNHVSSTPIPATGEKKATKQASTQSSATILVEDIQLPNAVAPSQAATTQISATAVRLNYPCPPKINSDRVGFRCPCCCQVIATAYAQKTRWRKHIAEDVSPYTCILPNCPVPNTLYVTKESWKSHLLEDHPISESWVCFACDSAINFVEEDDFVVHMQSQHSNAISASQIPVLKAACMRKIPNEVTTCPLCNEWSPEQGRDHREALIDHIAEEVHEFSLRSLPWAPDDTNDDNERTRIATAKTQEWLTRYELSSEEQKDAPPPAKAEITPRNHYFDFNDYFAEENETGDESSIYSNESIAHELENLRNEGSLKYDDRSTENDLDDLEHKKTEWNTEILDVDLEAVRKNPAAHEATESRIREAIDLLPTKYTRSGSETQDINLLYYLAMTLQFRGKYSEATEATLQLQNVDFGSATAEASRISVATCVASILYFDGKYLAALNQMGPPRHVLGLGQEPYPPTLNEMIMYTECLLAVGSYEKAQKYYEESVALVKSRLTGNIAESQALSANILRSRGSYLIAEAKITEALRLSEPIYERNDPYTLTMMSNYAEILRNLGKFEQALTMNIRVIEASSVILGSDHPETLTTMDNLAATYRNLGRLEEAADLSTQVLEKSLRVLRVNHPDVLASTANLALIRKAQGKMIEAEELERNVMERSIEELGRDHPDTLTSIGNYAATLSLTGRWRDAALLEENVLICRRRVLGEEHPDTRIAEENLDYTRGMLSPLFVGVNNQN